MTDSADAHHARNLHDHRSLRWGIASTGGIARAMARALATVPDAEIVAVGSRTQDAADAFAATNDIARAHGSHSELCADPDVDIVYVASPHNHHRSMTIEALDAGKHVLCEKAFALNAGEAREMIAAARTNERFLMEAMWTWFIPAVVEAKRRIDEGAIGDVVAVDADFGLRLTDPDGRHRRPDLAGGALLDLGIYPLAIARFLLGEPVEVRAVGRLTDEGLDAAVAGVLRFSSGAVATFHSSLDGHGHHAARIVGSEATMEIEPRFWHAEAFTITRGDETERVEIPHRGLAHEAEHAMARIRGGHVESDVMTWDTTLANMELMDEIRRQLGVVYPEER